MILAGILLLLLIGYFAFSNGDNNNNKIGDNPSVSSKAKTKNQNQAAPEIPDEAASFQNPEAAAAAIKKLTRHSANDPMAKGKLDAPVTMIQFIDFSCPMCIKFEAETAPQLEKYVKDGTLRIEFHNFPIFASNYKSDLAAAGAIAAGKQGKFWEYLKSAVDLGLIEGHVNWNETKVEQVAKAAGITNLAKFKKDMNAPEIKAEIEKDKVAAQQFGIAGTPAFFLNNRIIPGALPYTVFAQTIEAMKVGAK